jgi:hypothetical protein
MSKPGEGHERRSQPRLRSSGRAWIYRSPQHSDELVIRDISTTGARVLGTARLYQGEHVGVRMQLGDAVIELVAEVVRTDPQRLEAALMFRNLAAAARTAIEQAIASMIDEVRTGSRPAVLVLHADADVRAALERDLSRLDRGASLCATSLEALWAVDDRSRDHVAVIIDADLGERLVAMVGFFAETHPSLRRVLLFKEQLGAVDSAIARQVDAMLRVPWRIRALSRAIGIDSTDSSIALLAAELDE